jgi:hypothetical protein
MCLHWLLCTVVPTVQRSDWYYFLFGVLLSMNSEKIPRISQLLIRRLLLHCKKSSRKVPLLNGMKQDLFIRGTESFFDDVTELVGEKIRIFFTHIHTHSLYGGQVCLPHFSSCARRGGVPVSMNKKYVYCISIRRCCVKCEENQQIFQ